MLSDFAIVTAARSNFSSKEENGGTVTASDQQTQAPVFADPAAGDFHQAGSSPTVDAGLPSGVTADERDIDGEGRPAGGGPDIGADEVSGAPIATTGDATADATSATLRGTVDTQGPATAWHFETSSGAEAVVPTATQTVSASSGPKAVSVTITGLRPSTTYAYRLLASNPNGDSTAFIRSITTAAAPDTGPLPGTTPLVLVPADTVAPVLGALSLSHRRFVVGAALTPTTARTPAGTTLRFKVSEAGTATILVQRTLAGRRRGARCVKPTAALRRARRCTRASTVATLRRVVRAGSVAIPFSGRIGGPELSRRLATGSYRFVVEVADAAGNRSDSAATAFTVARR